MKRMTGAIIVTVALLCAAGASAQSTTGWTAAQLRPLKTSTLCVDQAQLDIMEPTRAAVAWREASLRAVDSELHRRHANCTKNARVYYIYAAYLLRQRRAHDAQQRASQQQLQAAAERLAQANRAYAESQRKLDTLNAELAQLAQEQETLAQKQNSSTWQSRLSRALTSPAFQNGVRLMEQAGPHTLGNTTTTSCSPDGMHHGGFNCTTTH